MRLRRAAGCSARARFAVTAYDLQLTKHVSRLRPTNGERNLSCPWRKADAVQDRPNEMRARKRVERRGLTPPWRARSRTTRGWPILNLDRIRRQALAFEYDDNNPRIPHLFPGQFVATSECLRIGLSFDPAIAELDVVELALAAGEELAYYFGWPWRKDWMGDEVQKIVDGVLPTQ
jgi:hypothetical protein